MKVEIETNKYGECNKFKINEMDLGYGIYKVELIVEAGEKAKMILTCDPEKIIYNGESVDIFNASEQVCKDDIVQNKPNTRS